MIRRLFVATLLLAVFASVSCSGGSPIPPTLPTPVVPGPHPLPTVEGLSITPVSFVPENGGRITSGVMLRYEFVVNSCPTNYQGYGLVADNGESMFVTSWNTTCFVGPSAGGQLMSGLNQIYRDSRGKNLKLRAALGTREEPRPLDLTLASWEVE
jgi:hypothetical protein